MAPANAPVVTADCHARPTHPRRSALVGNSLVLLLVATLGAACFPSTGPSGSQGPSRGNVASVEASASASALAPTPDGGSPAPSAPAPTPSPTPASGPSRLISHGDRGSGKVAITFTVGYRLVPALEILELLRERGVAATIFMSGIVFDQDTTRATAERALEMIAERPDLFQLGQHGYSARELPGLSVSAATAEVQDAEVTLARYGAPDLRPYFSPPGGARSAAVLEMLGSLGYSTSVLWDVDPLDWKPPADGGPSAEEVAARVLAKVQGGSIVLLHLGGWNTLPALPAIIDGLAQRGLHPVTIAELLAGS